MNPGLMGSLLRETVVGWFDDGASRLAASLAYYTTFSLAPLLILVISITSVFFAEEAVTGEIGRQLSSLVGPDAAAFIQDVIARARYEDSRGWASVFGILALLFGATGAFAELQSALNTVWEVEPKPGRGIRGILESRFLSFAMVLGIGFLLLVSLVVSAGLAVVTSAMGRLLGAEALLAQILAFVGSFVVATVLFAMIYKVLPDVEIQWRDVWVGAAATALLFSGGKLLIGLYLGRSAVASSYGAAAALAILLLWVYYSAQIVLLGAEFTEVYARRFGSRILPSPGARPASEALTQSR